MADIYLRSTDGSDVDDGLTWANAKATLASALTAAGAGGRVFMADAHAETQASAMTLASPGTAASPVQILCVDDTGDPEPPTGQATTGTVTTTGNNAISFSGFAYCYGVTFTAGSGNSASSHLNFTSASAWWWQFESCSLRIASNNAGPKLAVGGTANTNDDNLLELYSTSTRWGASGQGFHLHAPMRWYNSSAIAAGGTVPTTLFPTGGSNFAPYGRAILRGVDLSSFGSGRNLVGVGADYQDFLFENCKLGASVSITTGTRAGQGGTTVELINCDSADTNYRYHKHCYQGDITQETTIVRTGGATDGTTPVSRKMVSTANSKFYSPLEGNWILYWNEATGSSITVTIEVITDNVTLTDAEAWIEVEYLGTSGSPLALYANDRAADILATPANQATSTVDWITTGLTTPVKQRLSVSVTPQEKGLIRARVMLARASTTMYFDPLILASSGRQFMLGKSGFMNEAMLSPFSRARKLRVPAIGTSAMRGRRYYG
jgi:hypothetical protein